MDECPIKSHQEPFDQTPVNQPFSSDPLPAATSTSFKSDTHLGNPTSPSLFISSLPENSTFAAPSQFHLYKESELHLIPGKNGQYPSLGPKPLSPVPEETLAHAQTPISVNSSDNTLGHADFSQSFVFQDLHEIEPQLESNYVYTAIEYAFECKALTYGQATELRNKVNVLVEIYGQWFRLQKNMQEIVMNQIRYYQDHYEELNEAETLPWRMRQQLQGLRGDTQRLNDELLKSNIHLTQLESEIIKYWQ
jgi:hypothetical protein